MDIITYALCKKLISSVAGGISGYEIDGLTLKITTSDGQVLEMTFPEPKDGISINDVKINESNHLICIMSDENEIDAGLIKTVQGPKGDPFKYEDFTPEQLEALTGPAGKDGQPGKDGYTPQKGIDYFTQEDIEGLKEDLPFDDYLTKKDASLTYAKNTDIENFITKDTDNLTNYYDKKTIDEMIAGGGGGSDYPDATTEDIDKLFENEPAEALATEEDIDALFE